MFIAALFILYSNQDHMDLVFSSVQFSHSMCPALCDLVDCRTSGFPAISNHQSILTLMTPVSDAIEASRLLSSSSVHPPACNLSQHQGLFQWVEFFASVGSLTGVSPSTSVLLMYIQDWFPLERTGLILQSKRLSRVFSNTTAQKHQFFSTQLSL